MAQGVDFERIGLPLPHPGEVADLQRLARERLGDRSLLGDIARQAMAANPRIMTVLSNDVAMAVETDEVMMDTFDPAIGARSYGIHEGFGFMVGSITRIRFLRSGQRDLFNFLIEAHMTAGLAPVSTDAHLDRILQVMRGQAVAERLPHPKATIGATKISSAESATALARTYLVAVPAVATLGLWHAHQSADFHAHPHYMDGVYRGMQTAATMYTETHQQAMLDAFEKDQTA